MTKSVKNRPRTGRPAPPMMSKAERRAAGKLAREKRKRAARRRRILRRVVPLGAGLVVIGLLAAWAFGVFDSRSDTPEATSTPSPSISLDPALYVKPTVDAGTGELKDLMTRVIVEGTGPALKTGQRVKVNYVGVRFQTGEEFDSTWSRNQPFEFTLGQGDVIEGWDRGLLGIKVGSRVLLDIPSDLAYTDNPASPGQPAGPLRFVIDVLSATDDVSGAS